MLDGVPLVTETGCFVYTADFASRNLDRATVSHNTPLVDGEEIYRFLGPEFLWNLLPDANQEAVEFSVGISTQRFVGRHDGYSRLTAGVMVERTIELSCDAHSLRVQDRFTGVGNHEVEVPLHLHPDVSVTTEPDSRLRLEASGRSFELAWAGAGWALEIGVGREAPSYGCRRPITRLAWRRTGELGELEILIRPASSGAAHWAATGR